MFIFDFLANAHVHSVHETTECRSSTDCSDMQLIDDLHPLLSPVYLMQAHISNFLFHTQSYALLYSSIRQNAL